MNLHRSFLCVGVVAILSAARAQDLASPLSGTQPLNLPGDLSARMVEGIDKFLLRKKKRPRQCRGRFRRKLKSSTL